MSVLFESSTAKLIGSVQNDLQAEPNEMQITF